MAIHAEDPKGWTETIDNLATMDNKQDVEEGAFIEKTDEEKTLVRKIDLFLMPTIWILYCFSYMVCKEVSAVKCIADLLRQDRTNIGNAKVAGMNDDIGVSSTQYFLAIVVFQIGYVIAEIPSKYGVSIMMPYYLRSDM